ncbi:hypothetical protein [uncultured Psychrobacter sp.]|uniref:hypothetical protein n=1 Tax=uncultured Psychrobacter sp. TaxID=259303 RepID=UPI003459A84B
MLLYLDVIHKKSTAFIAGIAVSSLLFLTGCNNTTNTVDENGVTSAATSTVDLSVFAGCYTVSYDEPAQIKVSEQSGMWVMQMKEPASANRVWDDAEPLEVLDNSDIPKFFSIDPDNVDAAIARPDRVLVMAHVKPVYANIDPLLDSEYLSYIYKGANTIYQVECDDTNTDILANPHANIVIDNVNESL